jgi:PAS domain S-box-containing protein
MSHHDDSRETRPVTFLGGLEAELREDFPEVLARNGMGGFLWDLASGLIYVDPGALAVFGLSPEGYDGREATLRGHVAPEDISALRALTAAGPPGSDNYGAYFRVRRSDDSNRWVHAQGSVQRDSTGRTTRVLGIVRDAGPELRQLTPQAVLEADRRGQADVVRTTTSLLAQALTVEDVTTALRSDEFLGSVGAFGIVLSLLEQDRLRRFVTTGLSPEILTDLEFTRIGDQLPLSEAVRTGIPLFITSDEMRHRYPKLWPYIRDTALSVGAVLPLVAQAQPLGALSILFAGKDTFTPEERNLLITLGATVAQSVQRAMLYDQEHAMAIGLRQVMLPRRIPDVVGAHIAVRYRAATTGPQIGGDWYDVFPLPAGRIGLVIGDVEGHDIHASAVMGQLRTALHAYAAEGHPPATIMARASTFLQDLDTSRRATCLYADLDPLTGDTRLVRAGHPGPLIRHPDGRISHPRAAGGPVLGLPRLGGGAPSYPVTDIRLRAAETMLLYTDGLIGLPGGNLAEGMRQVETVLRAGPTDTDLLAEHIVTHCTAARQQEDDIAVILVALTDPQPRLDDPASPSGYTG